MKIGLDFHGVIDIHPEFFSEFTKLFINAGHEIHILTGSSFNKEFKEDLKNMGICYTKVFSITDFLMSKNLPYIEQNGGKYFDDEIWNNAKSIYANNIKLDIHFDDIEKYASLFKIPFINFKKIK